MKRNRPLRTPAGAVIQSGLDPRPSWSMTPMQMATDVPYRAVVLNTYVTDEEDNFSGVSVECDVLLIRANLHLARVPVKQVNHGWNNAWAPWIPRPSTRVISTGDGVSFTTRSSRGTFQGEAPLPSDLDGDLVIVEFLERDIDRPIITGALSHEQSRRLVVGSANDPDAALGWKEGDYRQGSPRRNEYFISHSGSELRINGQGDVLISTVGATDDPVTEDASGNVGQIRFRVKSSQRLTVEMDGTDVLEVYKDGSQVKIDLGEGATQRLILGDDFRTFFNNQMQKINAFWTAVFNAHTHSGGTISGNTGQPNVTQVDSIDQMQTDLLSDLARTKKS